MKYYFLAWKQYVKFHGRASRREYWYFTFINLAISIGIHFTAHSLGYKDILFSETIVGQTIIDLVYLAAVLLPLICVGVRRMQDVNKTGWHLMIPIYGFWLAALPGVEEDNKYGSKAVL